MLSLMSAGVLPSLAVWNFVSKKAGPPVLASAGGMPSW